MKTGKRDALMAKWEKPRVLAVDTLRPASGHCAFGSAPRSDGCFTGANTGSQFHECEVGGTPGFGDRSGSVLRAPARRGVGSR
jgi:hypothetical protein